MKSSDFKRSDRLSDQIKMEISSILRNDVRDPRLEGITIIKVEISNDISRAYIYFSALNSFKQIDLIEVEQALKRAKGYIRVILGKRLKIKRLPEISFLQDQQNLIQWMVFYY